MTRRDPDRLMDRLDEAEQNRPSVGSGSGSGGLGLGRDLSDRERAQVDALMADIEQRAESDPDLAESLETVESMLAYEAEHGIEPSSNGNLSLGARGLLDLVTGGPAPSVPEGYDFNREDLTDGDSEGSSK